MKPNYEIKKILSFISKDICTQSAGAPVHISEKQDYKKKTAKKVHSQRLY
jgi:hypothetical protein